MILKVFSIYDSKAEAFLQPFYMQSKGAAIRSFADAVSDEKTMFFKHPSDYTLFELGEFDDSNASFNLHISPISLGLAVEFKKENA